MWICLRIIAVYNQGSICTKMIGSILAISDIEKQGLIEFSVALG